MEPGRHLPELSPSWFMAGLNRIDGFMVFLEDDGVKGWRGTHSRNRVWPGEKLILFPRADPAAFSEFSAPPPARCLPRSTIISHGSQI